jgi:biopolymer transport protein ExbD
VSFVIALLAVALLAAVILLISAPLRTARRRTDLPSAELVELEAAREAKYSEIRDAELDYRTGKLSREDYESVAGALRTEALELLNRLQALQARGLASDERGPDD